MEKYKLVATREEKTREDIISEPGQMVVQNANRLWDYTVMKLSIRIEGSYSPSQPLLAKFTHGFICQSGELHFQKDLDNLE